MTVEKAQIYSICTWLEEILGCPLLERSLGLQKLSIDEDTSDYFESEDQKTKMLPFLIPGRARTTLFEWLLLQFDQSIFDGIKNAEGSEEKIVIALKEVGIVNFNDKRGGTRNELLKSVQGLNGFADSIQLLYRLIKFVINSRLADTMGDTQLLAMSDKLMNHLSINSASIFQTQVRLFPPGFPKSGCEPILDDQFEGLGELVEDLSEKIKLVSLKLDKVKSIPGAEVFVNNIDCVKFATNEDISNLQRSLQTLRDHVLHFNQEYDENIKRKLRSGASNQEQTRLGEAVAMASEQRQQFDSMAAQFRNLIEKIGVIGVNLQIAGNDEQAPQIFQEKILDLIGQVKSLKLSVVFNSKMGALY
ncbi:hypothetical protein FGO68_gene2375 [Halteria grandinella]|uniref:Uncharacterized protein n=1 Tax=Halteria grandinella TaxID=5974 RepID=A0A8J8NV28_HALGN|nr:hypothetical protein FGO68_gene2375 [Halteria grandinella]